MDAVKLSFLTGGMCIVRPLSISLILWMILQANILLALIMSIFGWTECRDAIIYRTTSLFFIRRFLNDAVFNNGYSGSFVR